MPVSQIVLDDFLPGAGFLARGEAGQNEEQHEQDDNQDEHLFHLDLLFYFTSFFRQKICQRNPKQEKAFIFLVLP
jgi:hypothetical protein